MMSEENKTIYCTQCGSENNSESKFCHNCGNKLEKAAEAVNDQQSTGTEGIFSGQDTKPVYEKITDAEEEAPAPIPSYREEIKINYSQEPQHFSNESQNTETNGSSNIYNVSSQPQYYSTDGNASGAEIRGGGNIGFAIASMICGIFSIVCCCFTLFSAVLAVAAVVLGIITLCFKYDGKGMAIAGIATGGVGLIIVIVSMILSGTAAYNELRYDLFDDLYY